MKIKKDKNNPIYFSRLTMYLMYLNVSKDLYRVMPMLEDMLTEYYFTLCCHSGGWRESPFVTIPKAYFWCICMQS